MAAVGPTGFGVLFGGGRSPSPGHPLLSSSVFLLLFKIVILSSLPLEDFNIDEIFSKKHITEAI